MEDTNFLNPYTKYWGEKKINNVNQSDEEDEFEENKNEPEYGLKIHFANDDLLEIPIGLCTFE